MCPGIQWYSVKDPLSSLEYRISFTGSMYALLQIIGVVVIHNPRSSSRGQFLSSCVVGATVVAKHLRKNLRQTLQLSGDGLSWFGHGVSGRSLTLLVSASLQMYMPLSSHKSAKVVTPKYSRT
eukprot:14019983-Ditylum_brightwellii.AAC.1